LKLQGMTAVVTGAGRGIGEKITELFIDNGATVAGIDLDEDGLQAQQQKYGEKFIPFICDITKSGDVDKTVKSIAEKTLKIDILVNNAGVTRDNLFVIMKEEEFDFVINVNLKGTFLMSKAVAKIMRKQKTGSIINISSVVGVEGNVGQANYAASKAGVIGLTRTLARELTLKGEEIRVNAVAPGFIMTSMTESLKDEYRSAIIGRSCIKRLGNPLDVAKTVLFLASQDSSFITGQVIRVDGGISI